MLQNNNNNNNNNNSNNNNNKILHIDVDDSYLKVNYLIGYLEEVLRSLVLIIPKMSGYAKTF